MPSRLPPSSRKIPPLEINGSRGMFPRPSLVRLSGRVGCYGWLVSVAYLSLAVLLTPFGSAYSEIEQQEMSVPPPRDDVVSYQTEILGISEDKLRSLLKETSQLIALRKEPPATLAGLERRITGDLGRFETVLRSEGFYDSRVRYDVDTESRPVKVTIHVSTGPIYRLVRYDIRYVKVSGETERLPTDIEELGFRIGMAARAPLVTDAERSLLRKLGESGHPLARIVDRNVIVDHGDRTMSVIVDVDAGPAARLGPVVFDGLADVEEDYVRQFVGWDSGELYDQRKVDALRSALLGTGLFTSVKIEHANTVSEEGTLTITITVVESKHRSIGVGVSYSTDIGFGGEVFWEHRNLFGRQERLKISASASEIVQNGGAEFRKPNFRRQGQELVASAQLTRQETDAFEEHSVLVFGGLDRRIDEYWTVSAGVPIEYSILDDSEGERTFTLFGLSLAAARNSTDSTLDPTRGSKLQLSLVPYYGFDDENVSFLVSEGAGSAYLSLTKEDRIVLAGRAKFGSIVGESTETLPANKRFYAGGGGSIRGYEFQKVGPLDQDDDPLGGRSIVEVGAELRLRITEAIGIVPFIEGGNVFDEVVPDFSREFQWAAGLGLRYFTAIGPLRLDVAFPLNRRDVDDTFQFYISIGQAF